MFIYFQTLIDSHASELVFLLESYFCQGDFLHLIICFNYFLDYLSSVFQNQLYVTCMHHSSLITTLQYGESLILHSFQFSYFLIMTTIIAHIPSVLS